MLPERSLYSSRTLLVILIAAVYRMVFLWLYPMGPDEASYWTWSCHLDLGYVDHPPLVAYAIRMMTELLGDHAWSSRILACILAAGSSWFLFSAGRELFSPRVGFWAATLHAVCPMYSMAGGIMLLPESILTFWITMAIYVSAKLVTTENLKLFYVLGAILGLAVLTKYPGVLIAAALGLFALCSSRHRHWYCRKEPYLMVLIGILMFSPVIIWNIKHNYACLAFLSGRTDPADAIASPVARVAESVAAQAGYHSPILFALLWYGTAVLAINVLRGKPNRDSACLTLAFSAPVMLAFLAISAFRYTLPHWPAAGYLAAYIAAPAALLTEPLTSKTRRRATTFLTAAAGLAALLSALMPILLVYPLTTVCYPHIQPLLHLPKDALEPMAQCHGWGDSVADELKALRLQVQDQTGITPVILTHDHLQASLLARGLRNECEVVALHARGWQFNIWYDDTFIGNKPVIYVSSDMSSHFQGEPQDHYVFEECVSQPDLPIVVSGVTINTVHFWVCTGYHGPIGKRCDWRSSNTP